MWARIEPLLPSSDGQRGRPFRDHRQMLEGIVFRLRTGVPWRDLPADFGPWQTAWKRYSRFAMDGTWDKILTRLQVDADAAGELDWTVSVDSTVVRVHQHGATAGGRVTAAAAGPRTSPGAASNYKNPPDPRREPADHASEGPAADCRGRPIPSSTAKAAPWSF